MNLSNSTFMAGIHQFLNVGNSSIYITDYVNLLKKGYLIQAALEQINEDYPLAKITVAKLCKHYTKYIAYPI